MPNISRPPSSLSWLSLEKAAIKPSFVVFGCSLWSALTGACSSTPEWSDDVQGPANQAHVNQVGGDAGGGAPFSAPAASGASQGGSRAAAAGSSSGGSAQESSAGAGGRGGSSGSAGMATSGGAAGGGGASPVTSAPCPRGSVLTAVTATAGTARYGTVFGTTLYQADDPSTYNPQKITVQVSNGGVPVAGCEVAFAADHGNGWVFPDAKTTDASGRLSAYWTAGTLPNQAATATIAIEGGGSSSANINGNAQPIAETRGNSIHFTAYASSSYTEYEVQVTPVTAPPTTYYETQGWSGAYGGIQFDGASTQVLFSVWSTDSQSAQLRDGGACNVTVKFSGEGTGTSCRLRFPPSANGAVPGLPSDYMLRAGDTYQTHLLVSYPDDCNDQCTDYTFTFTDLTRHLGPISLGTQRYMAKVEPSYNDSFVEDWGSSPGDDCISAGARTAYFHDMRARVAGTWKPIVSGSFSPNFVPTNSEICANYYAGVESGKFLLSSGGDTLVGPPLFGKRRQLTLQ